MRPLEFHFYKAFRLFIFYDFGDPAFLQTEDCVVVDLDVVGLESVVEAFQRGATLIVRGSNSRHG